MLPRRTIFKNEKIVSVLCDKQSSYIWGVTLKKMIKVREFSGEQMYKLLLDTINLFEVTCLVCTQYNEHFCTLYTFHFVHCTLYTFHFVHCTLYTFHCLLSFTFRLWTPLQMCQRTSVRVQGNHRVKCSLVLHSRRSPQRLDYRYR